MKINYLVGEFNEHGDCVQISFLPIHPDPSQSSSAVGLWRGQGLRGDGKHVTPREALKMKYSRLKASAKTDSDIERFPNGLEFVCREAGCLWFLDFVRRLAEGTASVSDFLAEYRLHNNGAEPRSDAKSNVFL